MLGESHIREALGLNETQKGTDQMNKEDLKSPVTEWELSQKAVAPRVTDEQVEAFIVRENYFTGTDGVIGAAIPAVRPQLSGATPELDVLTFCVLTLANGFTVHGFSACADRNNFDPEIGRRIARANAKAHVWGHLGFELKTKIDMAEKASVPSMAGMTTHVGTKVIHATPMNRYDYNRLRGWPLPPDEIGTDEGYLVEYADGGDANVDGFAGYVSWSPKAVFDRAYGNPLR